MQLTSEQRNQLIEMTAERWADSMDIGDLIQFFMEAQMEYLDDQTDADLIQMANETGIYLDEENENV